MNLFKKLFNLWMEQRKQDVRLRVVFGDLSKKKVSVKITPNQLNMLCLLGSHGIDDLTRLTCMIHDDIYARDLIRKNL